MQASASLGIGALAKRAGCNVPTIRYYEEIGLLPRAARRDGGHRIYSDADLRRLTFIRRCRDFGFPVEDVRSLLALTEDRGRNCADARDRAQAHLDVVRDKLAELKTLERNLARFVDDCTATCLGGPGPDCLIVHEIARTRPGKRKQKTKRCCG